MKRIQKNWIRGFTLTELLVVVAILGVLIAVAIPVFGSARDKASAAQCLANRTMISRTIQIEHILDPDKPLDTITSAVLAAAKSDGGGYFVGACGCNEGGTYTNQNGVITCSVAKHGGTGGGDIPQPPKPTDKDMVQQMAELLEERDADNEAFKKKYGIPNNSLGNSTMRGVLCKTAYGGVWPKLSTELQEQSGSDVPLYIQPFVPTAYQDGKNIILFAGTQSDAKDGWATLMVGHTNLLTGRVTWYRWNQKGTAMLTRYNTSGWAGVQAEIDEENSKWTKIT